MEWPIYNSMIIEDASLKVKGSLYSCLLITCLPSGSRQLIGIWKLSIPGLISYARGWGLLSPPQNAVTGLHGLIIFNIVEPTCIVSLGRTAFFSLGIRNSLYLLTEFYL